MSSQPIISAASSVRRRNLPFSIKADHDAAALDESSPRLSIRLTVAESDWIVEFLTNPHINSSSLFEYVILPTPIHLICLPARVANAELKARGSKKHMFAASTEGQP